MEQTAVEWLVEQLFKTNNNTTDSKKMDSESIIQQAKEMEKQQSIDFACEVYNSHYYRDTKSFKQVSEEHYIKTYKKQQNG